MNADLALTQTPALGLRETRVVPSSAKPLAMAVGFYFSFRLVFALLAVRIFSRDPQDGAVVNLACNYLLLMVAAFCAMGPAPRTLGSILRLPATRWVLVFIGFSGVSLL